jgi:hypothetical protein
VDAYRVSYRTVDANGRPVVATGLVALPERGPASLPVVSYDHGTTATSADVPSSFGLGRDHAVEGRWSAELFASAGFATAADRPLVRPAQLGLVERTPLGYHPSGVQASSAGRLP